MALHNQVTLWIYSLHTALVFRYERVYNHAHVLLPYDREPERADCHSLAARERSTVNATGTHLDLLGIVASYVGTIVSVAPEGVAGVPSESGGPGDAKCTRTCIAVLGRILFIAKDAKCVMSEHSSILYIEHR